MTATYTVGSTADRDRLRLKIADYPLGGGDAFAAATDADFQDEELDDILSQEGDDLDLSAAHCYEVLAGRAARSFDFTADGATFRRGMTVKELRQQAKIFRARGRSGDVVEPERKDGYSTTVHAAEVNEALIDGDFDRPGLST
tara:strand:+ start:7470 stop:7898 length:429 start_codon:yes stop_codon:yes gene_type:complete